MTLLENMREVFRMLRHRKPTKGYCPRCASPKIRLTSTFYGLAPRKYTCENCGYAGPVVMELEKEES